MWCMIYLFFEVGRILNIFFLRNENWVYVGVEWECFEFCGLRRGVKCCLESIDFFESKFVYMVVLLGYIIYKVEFGKEENFSGGNLRKMWSNRGFDVYFKGLLLGMIGMGS